MCHEFYSADQALRLQFGLYDILQPIRIQESCCIFDGIQLNLLIVRCISYSCPNFKSSLLYFLGHGIKQLSNTFSWHTMESPTCHLYFLSKHMSLQASVYNKKIQVTSGRFHGIPQESIVKLECIRYQSSVFSFQTTVAIIELK